MRDYINSLPQLASGLILAALLSFLLDRFLGGEFNPFLLWIFSIGLITFVAYGIDKAISRRATRGKWRVREWTFHQLALTGGVLGGWLGMFRFRHKTKDEHSEFRVVLWIATILWVWILWQQL